VGMINEDKAVFNSILSRFFSLRSTNQMLFGILLVMNVAVLQNMIEMWAKCVCTKHLLDVPWLSTLHGTFLISPLYWLEFSYFFWEGWRGGGQVLMCRSFWFWDCRSPWESVHIPKRGRV